MIISFIFHLQILKIYKRNESIGTMLTCSFEVDDFPFGFVDRTEKLVEGIYVMKIIDESPADKCENLEIGDRIISVNGESLEGKNLREAMDIFHDLTYCYEITLHVQHLGPPPGYNMLCIVRQDEQESFGFKIIGGSDTPFCLSASGSKNGNGASSTYSGIYIQDIVPDSPASREDQINLRGCQFITVDNVSVLGLSQDAFIDILLKCSTITEFTYCSAISSDLIKDAQFADDENCKEPIVISNSIENSNEVSPFECNDDDVELTNVNERFPKFLNDRKIGSFTRISLSGDEFKQLDNNNSSLISDMDADNSAYFDETKVNISTMTIRPSSLSAFNDNDAFANDKYQNSKENCPTNCVSCSPTKLLQPALHQQK